MIGDKYYTNSAKLQVWVCSSSLLWEAGLEQLKRAVLPVAWSAFLALSTSGSHPETHTNIPTHRLSSVQHGSLCHACITH